MLRIATTAVVSLLAFTAAAGAAPELVRVRGTIESATDASVTVRTHDGKMQDVAISADTAFVNVVKSSLDEVGEGKFIGTATKGDNPMTALEVVIFPDSMKGAAEGHYAWDEINDTTASSGGSMAKTSMTNGTAKPVTSGGGMTKSSMTNGTVKAGKDAGGSKSIEVTYDGGQSKIVQVPASAPIVAFEKADKSIVTKGAPVFIVSARDGDTLGGKLVAVGKDGVVPPM